MAFRRVLLKDIINTSTVDGSNPMDLIETIEYKINEMIVRLEEGMTEPKWESSKQVHWD